ncbi:MAG TPA: hypothetical protein VF214_04270 [Edaphobacter sp.]
MKPTRLILATLLGLTLSATPVLAENSSGNGGSHWSFGNWIYNLIADSHRQCDQYGQDTGRGNNCDHGRGNGGGYCGTGGSTSGGGSSSGGGTTSGGGSTSGTGNPYK